MGWRGTARTRLAKAARSANRPRQYAHFSRCSRMTLEESALSSPSKYASSSLSKSRQLIRSLRGTAVTLWMAARQAAVLSDRELATPRCQLATHRLGPRRGNPCDVAQQLESIVPGDNQLRRFIPSGADTRTDECARHRPRLRRRDTSRGSHWNKRRPEAVLPVGRRGCPSSAGPESECQCSRCASRAYRSP